MPRFRTRLTLLAAASVVPGLAQAQASSFGSGKAVGVTVQAVTRFEGFADPLAVGLHFTLIRASGPDFDFEIATLPTFIAGGALFLAPNVGIGHTFPIGGGALMLKAGPSAVLLATGMGSGAWWGLHAVRSRSCGSRGILVFASKSFRACTRSTGSGCRGRHSASGSRHSPHRFVRLPPQPKASVRHRPGAWTRDRFGR